MIKTWIKIKRINELLKTIYVISFIYITRGNDFKMNGNQVVFSYSLNWLKSYQLGGDQAYFQPSETLSQPG